MTSPASPVCWNSLLPINMSVMTMTKKTLIETMAASLNVSQVEALTFINSWQALLVETLLQEGAMTLQGLGSFRVKTRAARSGRNPRTGAALLISERQVVQFRASSTLVQQLNQD